MEVEQALTVFESFNIRRVYDEPSERYAKL
jgi:hypothetical protein